MKCSITIPHQHVEISPGDMATLRGELSVDRVGGARGRLVLLSRDGARRYRALAGTVRVDDRGRFASASIQVETIERGGRLEELTSIEIAPIETCDHGATVPVRLALDSPRGNIPALTCKATIQVDSRGGRGAPGPDR